MEENWDEVSAWARSLDQDPRAFASIFDHHANQVFRHALRLVRNVHDAEEVTAASFYELWRRRTKVRVVQGSTLPWLLVTATNISLNTRRSVRRYRALLDRLPQASTSESIPVFLDDRGDVYLVVKQLPPIDGSLLVLTAVEGLPVNEAARLLGISEGAARVRLHRTRQRLQKQIDQNGQMRPKAEGVTR